MKTLTPIRPRPAAVAAAQVATTTSGGQQKQTRQLVLVPVAPGTSFSVRSLRIDQQQPSSSSVAAGKTTTSQTFILTTQKDYQSHPVVLKSMPAQNSNNNHAASRSAPQTPQQVQGVQSEKAVAVPRTLAARREYLKRKIGERPARHVLVTKHILLSDAKVDPLVSEKTRLLRKNSLVSTLNRKLRQRPGPLELVTKKILQVDAELEQAIHEGRLLFPTTSQRLAASSSESSAGRGGGRAAAGAAPCSPSVLLSSTLERTRLSNHGESFTDCHKRQPSVEHEAREENASADAVPSSADLEKTIYRSSSTSSSLNELSAVFPEEMEAVDFSSGGQSKSKMRKKHPYRVETQSPVQLSAKSKVKVPECNSQTLDYTMDESGARCTPPVSNYDLLMQQQKLMLEWQSEKAEEERQKVSGMLRDTESDSGDTIPYGDDDSPVSFHSPPIVAALTSTTTSSPPTLSQPPAAAEFTECLPQPLPPPPLSAVTKMGTASAATTAPPPPRPATLAYRPPIKSIGDLKVSELKEECRQRQMPMSGTKAQLIDRLKGHEDEVVSHQASLQAARLSASNLLDGCEACAKQSPASSHACPEHAASTTHSSPVTLPTEDRKSASSCESEQCESGGGLVGRRHSMPPEMAHSAAPSAPMPSSRHLSISTGSSSSSSSHIVHATNHLFPSQMTPATSTTGSSALLMQQDSAHPAPPLQQLHQPVQLPQPTPQIIQVLDSTGHIFLATVRSETLLNDGSGPAQPLYRLSTIPGGSGQAILQRVQTIPKEPVLRFAQNGCGGQLTLSRPPPPPDPSAKPHPSMVATSVSNQKLSPGIQAIRIASGMQPSPVSIPTTTVLSGVPRSDLFITRPAVAMDTRAVPHGNQQPPPRAPPAPPPNQRPAPIPKSTTTANGRARKQPQLGKSSPPTADQASSSSPNLPPPPSTASTECDSSVKDIKAPSPLEITEMLLNGEKFKFDEKTIAQHEEMMRFQQRKISQIQKELRRSQAALKHQQQLIIAAKNAQVTDMSRRSGGEIDSRSDAWLLQLDSHQLNRFHMQFFLNHKKQLQTLEDTVNDQRDLEATEKRLLNEEHVEQAVQDIVRLIRQDNRTAVLIVQLLRRYQLERNQVNTAASSAETKVEEAETSTSSSCQTPAPGTPHEAAQSMTPRLEQPPSTGQGAVTILKRTPTNHRAETTHVVQQKSASRAAARAKARVLPASGSGDPKKSPPPIVVISDDADDSPPPLPPKVSTEKKFPSSSIPTSSSSGSLLCSNANHCSPPDSTSGGGSGVDMEEIFKSVIDPSKHTKSSSCSSPSKLLSSSLNIAAMHHSNDAASTTSNFFRNHSFSSEIAADGLLPPSHSDDIHMSDFVMDHDNNLHFGAVDAQDILMEAVESSGIHDSAGSCSVGDDVTCNSAQNPLLEGGDGTQDDMFLNDGDLDVANLMPSFNSAYDLVDMDDLMDILRDDQSQPISRSGSSSNASAPMQYNGSAELSRLLGDSWLDEIHSSKTTTRPLECQQNGDDALENALGDDSSSAEAEFLNSAGEEVSSVPPTTKIDSPQLDHADMSWLDETYIHMNDEGTLTMNANFNLETLFQEV